MSDAHGGKHDKLVMMANQIAQFFASYPEAEGVDGVVNHIGKFWDPRMRRGIYEHLDAGAAGLSPLALKALQKLAGQQPHLRKTA